MDEKSLFEGALNVKTRLLKTSCCFLISRTIKMGDLSFSCITEKMWVVVVCCISNQGSIKAKTSVQPAVH